MPAFFWGPDHTCFATAPTLALSGGSNRATVLLLNASPYRAIFRPYRPQVQDHIGATTILAGELSDRQADFLDIFEVAPMNGLISQGPGKSLGDEGESRDDGDGKCLPRLAKVWVHGTL